MVRVLQGINVAQNHVHFLSFLPLTTHEFQVAFLDNDSLPASCWYFYFSHSFRCLTNDTTPQRTSLRTKVWSLRHPFPSLPIYMEDSKVLCMSSLFDSPSTRPIYVLLLRGIFIIFNFQGNFGSCYQSLLHPIDRLPPILSSPNVYSLFCRDTHGRGDVRTGWHTFPFADACRYYRLTTKGVPVLSLGCTSLNQVSLPLLSTKSYFTIFYSL